MVVTFAILFGPLMLHSIPAVFFFGFVGGLAGEFINVYELRRSAPQELPKYLKSGFYWFISILMACAGGGLATLYGVDEMQALLVINIGASAPLIIRSFATVAPPISTPKID